MNSIPQLCKGRLSPGRGAPNNTLPGAIACGVGAGQPVGGGPSPRGALGITRNSRPGLAGALRGSDLFSDDSDLLADEVARIAAIDGRRKEIFDLQGQAARLLSPFLPSAAQVDTPETFVDHRTGEIITRSGRCWPLGAEKRLQRVARRVCKCLRVRRSLDVSIKQHGDNLSYDGLLTCNNVWVCPVCGAKVTERRRQEIVKAYNSWRSGGGACLMVTFTIRHDRYSPPGDVLRGLQTALRQFKAGRWFQSVKSDYSLRHTVTKKEVTFGDNGCHPHSHELWFFASEHDARSAIRFLKREGARRWLDILDGLGLVAGAGGRAAVLRRGFGVEYCTDLTAAEYVSKMGYAPKVKHWGAAAELAKSHTKRGRSSASLTPWQLLEKSMDGDKHASAMWIEFVAAFFGKHLLEWSRGARAALGLVAEKSDEDIAKDDVGGVFVTGLTLDEWRVILRRNIRGEVLAIARRGAAAVHGYIRTICETSEDYTQAEIVNPVSYELAVANLWTPAVAAARAAAVERWASMAAGNVTKYDVFIAPMVRDLTGAA